MRLSPFFAALLLSVSAWASPLPVGVLTSTGTSVNQTTTAVPFSLMSFGIPDLFQVNIQCDAAACVLASTSVTCTTGAANSGVTLAASQLFPMCIIRPSGGDVNLAAISVSGTVHCQVWYEPVATQCH